MWPIDIINYSRPRLVNKPIFFTEPGVTMPMLVIFTNIISHPITRDRLINLRNVGTNETSLIPLAIQTRIANQCRLKCRYQWNLTDTISYPNPDS
jgi:hypothetical protein